MILRRVLALSSFCVLLAATARSQDSQQGALEYGPQGLLLDGSIIGGVSDLSASFYNPGALVLLETPRFTASFITGSWDRLETTDTSEGLTFESQPVSVQPSLVAGSLDHTGRAALSWFFLMRHQLDYDFAKSELSIQGSGASSSLYGRHRQRIREYWAGPTWSLRLKERVAFGISAVSAYRLQRFRHNGFAGTVDSAVGTSATGVLEQEYDHVRVLAKVGVAWRPGPFELGATFTSPGLAVWSSGRVRSVVSTSGGSSGMTLGGTDQSGLDASFRAPWSIAAGGTWRLRRTAVHASAEWFSSVDKKAILAADPAPIAGSDRTYPVSLYGGRVSALWAAASVERHVTDSTMLCASVSRDPSSSIPGADSLGGVDLTSVGAGVLFPLRKARVGLGIRYGWGDGPVYVTGATAGARTAAGSTASVRRLSFSFGTSNR